MCSFATRACGGGLVASRLTVRACVRRDTDQAVPPICCCGPAGAGFELRFAVNYLAHFFLVTLLTTKLIASAPARILHVISVSARVGAINFHDLQHAQVVKSRAHLERTSRTGDVGVARVCMTRKPATASPASHKRSFRWGSRTDLRTRSASCSTGCGLL